MSHSRLHPVLPIFAVQDGVTRAVYVPGHVLRASAQLLDELGKAWANVPADSPGDRSPAVGTRLVVAATAAMETWQRLHSEPFHPVNLNIELPYACNLRCAYCYTRPHAARSGAGARLKRDAIRAAASMVAHHARQQDLPFQFVVQGLGEPTLCWDDLRWCTEASRAAADSARVRWLGHISINGQLDDAQAKWVGETFTHVTVSCDGPPDIQDATRPRRDGAPSSARLPGCVSAIAAGGAALEARVTITSANVDRLPEVVGYIAKYLGVRVIRLEPVFAPAPQTMLLMGPEELARRCLAACAAGPRLEAEVVLSSPDLTRLHGEYCEAQRQTLRLGTDGKAVNCLHGVGGAFTRAVAFGHYDELTGRYLVDESAVARLCATAGKIPAGCADCINILHCTRSCPDACSDDRTGGYRCRFQRALAEAWILTAAAQPGGHEESYNVNKAGAEQHLRAEVAALPAEVDPAPILAEAQCALRHYSLEEHSQPAPAWAQEERRQHGAAAVETLMDEGRRRRGAISVYVHLPFCRSKCVFCDCHSVVAGHTKREQYAEYVTRLLRDLETWQVRGGMGGRLVTTVHFGGGTPAVIGYPLLADIAAAIRGRLAITPETEWAIETTSNGASPECIDKLLSLGIRRLHVGVQTLNDEIRRRLGRKTGSTAVLEHLRAAISKGMVTSVDLLYGLPAQDVRKLLEDITLLTGIGIHGISLYRLNLSSQNRALLRVFPGFSQQPLREYIMLQASEQMLFRAGYRKNHHLHYALSQDDDRYFRHATRGEDLLGLGASASGAVGPWEYLCERYPGYLRHAEEALPITAVAHTTFPGVWRELAAWLMAGWVPTDGSLPSSVDLLFSRWLSSGLLVPEQGGHRLTATGSWMLSAMLQELCQVITPLDKL